jgi:hypothetical protein
MGLYAAGTDFILAISTASVSRATFRVWVDTSGQRRLFLHWPMKSLRCIGGAMPSSAPECAAYDDEVSEGNPVQAGYVARLNTHVLRNHVCARPVESTHLWQSQMQKTN